MESVYYFFLVGPNNYGIDILFNNKGQRIQCGYFRRIVGADKGFGLVFCARADSLFAFQMKLNNFEITFFGLNFIAFCFLCGNN